MKVFRDPLFFLGILNVAYLRFQRSPASLNVVCVNESEFLVNEGLSMIDPEVIEAVRRKFGS